MVDLGRRLAGLLAAVAAGLLGACAAPTAPRPEPGAGPEAFTAAAYEALSQRGRPVYRLDPARSIAVIRVTRAGSLASLGHDHVVAARDMHGFIASDDGRADVYIALDTLTVDEPELRDKAGFDTQPSANDVAGTRTNMLDKVLEVERYPFATIAVRNASLEAGPRTVPVGISLHGTTRPIDVQLQILEATDRQLRASGAFSIAQTEFGITPYALLGGAIAVGNRVDVQFQLFAQRIDRSGLVTTGRREDDPKEGLGSSAR